MATANPEQVRAVVAPVLAEAGLDLEELTVTAAGRRRLLRISVDRDGGVCLDDVAAVSQLLSHALDHSDAMGGQPYVLEVGSPGVDRPLTEHRHWRRALGRLVEVSAGDGSVITGRLLTVDTAEAVLDTPSGHRRVDLAGVRRARVQVEFGREPDGPTNQPRALPDGSDPAPRPSAPDTAGNSPGVDRPSAGAHNIAATRHGHQPTRRPTRTEVTGGH